MKTIFRVSVLGLLITAFSVVSAFAQDPCADTYETKQAVYTIFRAGRPTPRTMDKTKAAVKAGEDFVAKYGACEDSKQVVDYINKNLPEMKEWVRKQEMYNAFDLATKDVKTVNPDAAFLNGKQIIALDTNSTTALDVALALSAIGYDNASKATPDYKFNNDTLTNAKMAIQKLEAGKTSESYGAWSYNFAIRDAQKKIDHVKSKANALAWMNYTIGTIMYYGQKQEKEALPFLYKAAQYDSEVKNKPVLYQAIGAWYLAELLKIDEQRLAKVKENGDKDSPETLAMLALEKGYAERGIDAYARAHKVAKDTKQSPDYIKSLYDKIQGLYKLRFDKTDGVDAYIMSITGKPLPDPASAVTPVVETPATTTTTSSTTTNPSTTPTPTTTTKPPTTTTKPATDSTTKPETTKPSSTTTKPAATNGTSTKGKINAKPKKKGTR